MSTIAMIECDICRAKATLSPQAVIRMAELTTFVAAHREHAGYGFQVSVGGCTGEGATGSTVAILVRRD